MPSNIILDPFRRFRFRPPPVPPNLPSSSDEDSDDSSPQCDRPRPTIHIPSPLKNPRKSGERLLNIPDIPKLSHAASERLTDSTPIALTFDKPPHPTHSERPSKRPSKPVAPSSDPVDVLHPLAKPTLIRRVTSKLNISIPSRSGSHALRSRPSTQTLPEHMRSSPHKPRSPKPAIVASPTLPNSIVSREKREAALRERGLLPPCKDLSVQEREADARLGPVPPPASAVVDGATEAELLKASWLATNRSSWCGDSVGVPDASRYSQELRSRPRSMLVLPSAAPPPDADAVRRSNEGKTDPTPLGRPSMSSSVPPLSPSSYLEVLHEDPAEQGPITPLPLVMHAPLPIIVTNSMEYPPSVLAESPISCSFSSHCPGSTLESQSHSDHRSMAEKNSMRSNPHRSRTSESYERHKVTGSSLTRLGSRSLSNLRRSVVGSLRIPSSSTLSSADLPARAAISPTMHSIGSIIRETKDIADAESRRLSELAFLD